MRGKDDRRAFRNLVQLIHEHRPERTQTLDDVPVVHHFVTHVDRRAEQLYRSLHDVDRAVDACAEASRIRQKNLHQGAASLELALVRRPSSKASSNSRPAPTQIAESATLNAAKYAS